MGKKTETKADVPSTNKISLSLRDLEKLGVIRKRLKRKRKNKNVKKIIQDVIGGLKPNNPLGGFVGKSDSNHLQKGYSNNFLNTSNLATETQRLQNNLLTDVNERHRKELINKDMENEKYKNQIHSALSTLYDAYKTPYTSNYTIEELPDEDVNPPTRFTELRNKSFYEPSDNIDVPRTDGSEYRFKGEPIQDESVAHQSLDTLKSIQSSLTPSKTGGSPRSDISNTSANKQNTIFSMFSGIRSTPNYRDEQIFPNDAQLASPIKEQMYENPLQLKNPKKSGISPRASQLQVLKNEAISLGIPEEDIAQETRQDAVKRLISRHKAEQKKNDEIQALVKYYTELSGRLNEPINTYLLDSPSSTLLKSAIKKLQATAKKQNIHID